MRLGRLSLTNQELPQCRTLALTFSGLAAAGAMIAFAPAASAGLTCVNSDDGKTHTMTLTSKDGTVLSETTYDGTCRSQKK